MGKWTPEYYDDVLGAKIKTLVTGAIARAGLEKNEPTISYERFVEELDTGDSFTSSIIDCLVKEIADRSSRPRQEPQIISRPTTRALHSLIAASHQAGSRYDSRRPHRIVGLSDFLTSDPEANSSGDERLDSAAEGARVNSELYEAYNTDPSHMVFPFIRQSSPDHTSNRGGSSSRQNSITIPTSSSSRVITSSSLTRQPSVRRARRSRTVVDFNEFTSRRRSSYRDALLNRSEEPTASNTPSESIYDSRRHPTRRFFPVSRRYDDFGGNSEDADSRDYLLSLPSWLLHPSPLRDEFGEQDTPIVPGVIPSPPSILSRQASPEADEERRAVISHSLPTPENEREGSLAAYPTPGYSSTGEEHL
ncbi:hypothetical protein PQX77_013820 [Marasmius sp. AFHP31]|nr:hypothetical protein PQX77_013820 [Marasmius sp. AFHP31]